MNQFQVINQAVKLLINHFVVPHGVSDGQRTLIYNKLYGGIIELIREIQDENSLRNN
jgi:hypothetical protein